MLLPRSLFVFGSLTGTPHTVQQLYDRWIKVKNNIFDATAMQPQLQRIQGNFLVMALN